MKKLENIPKKEVFNVPDGYFENLPARIQARIETQRLHREPAFVFRYKLQYAIPFLLLITAGVFWFTATRQHTDIDSLLATVQTEELMTYLNDSGLTTEDLLEQVEFDAEDLDEIEAEVYELNVSDEDVDDMLDTDIEIF